MNCPLQARRCGGCTRLGVPYERQLQSKNTKVRKFYPNAMPIRGMSSPVHYRNKVISAFAHDKTGLISGLYAFGTHFVLPVDECLLENERADEIVCAVRRILSIHGVKAYDEDKKTGLIRFVQVRYAAKTHQALVTLVTAANEFPQSLVVAKAILEACPDVQGVIQNVNNRPGSAVLGFREHTLMGKNTIQDMICGKHVLLSSRAFYQINTSQAEILYQCAMRMAKIGKQDRVIDAYCGIGIIGLIAANAAGHVTGIELNADAVRLAKQNAILNQCANIEFICGDSGRIMQKISSDYDVLLLDPPRSGCDEHFLQAVCTSMPKKICYISCNIITQKRDTDFLSAHGYKITGVQPVDLFPHTDHIENIVLLTK